MSNHMKNHHIIPKNIFNDVAYWHNAIVHWVVIATIFVGVSATILLAFFVHPSDALIRLQYNVFFGTSLHAPWWHAYLLSVMGAMFFLIDVMFGYVLYISKERVAAYIVLLGGLFAQIALLIAAVSVVVNNFIL